MIVIVQFCDLISMEPQVKKSFSGSSQLLAFSCSVDPRLLLLRSAENDEILLGLKESKTDKSG